MFRDGTQTSVVRRAGSQDYRRPVHCLAEVRIHAYGAGPALLDEPMSGNVPVARSPNLDQNWSGWYS